MLKPTNLMERLINKYTYLQNYLFFVTFKSKQKLHFRRYETVLLYIEMTTLINYIFDSISVMTFN